MPQTALRLYSLICRYAVDIALLSNIKTYIRMCRQAFFLTPTGATFQAFSNCVVGNKCLTVALSSRSDKVISFSRLLLLTPLFVFAQTMAVAQIEIEPISRTSHIIQQEPTSCSLSDGEFIVRLTGGPKRGRNSNHYISSGWLTVRGVKASVLLQMSRKQCRVHVLEGTVVIRNQLDRSVVKVCSGTAYETTRLSMPAAQDQFEERIDAANSLPLFETSQSQTVLYSLRDIEGAKRPGAIKAEIVSPPTITNYQVGSSVASLMPIPPELVAHFPPNGIMAPRSNAPAIASQVRLSE